MSESFEEALTALCAQDYDNAIALFERARCELDPVTGGEQLVRILVAICDVGLRDRSRRTLIEPALQEIASLINVDEGALGLSWHVLRVRADLFSGTSPAAERMLSFMNLVRRQGPTRSALWALASSLEAFDEHRRHDLAPPLHAIVRAVLESGGSSLSEILDPVQWMQISSVLRRTGDPVGAERICDWILTQFSEPEALARALLTKGILRAVEGQFGEARRLLREASELARRCGDDELIELVATNLATTYRHQPDRPGLERCVRDWIEAVERGERARPSIAATLALVRMLRGLDADIVALDVLALQADRDFGSDPAGAQLEWLEALVGVFRALADDATAAELCVRVIGLDDRLSRSATDRLGQDDYDRIARAYQHLVSFYSDLERFDEAMLGRTVSFLEASKEAAFSRALPGLEAAGVSAGVTEERRSLTVELARLEAAFEGRVRRDLDSSAELVRAVAGRDIVTAVIHAAREEEAAREQRIAIIKNRLETLRTGSAPELARFASFIAVGPDSLRESICRASWAEPTLGLSYRLDREEMELAAYVAYPDGRLEKHISEVNPTILDALLAVLSHFPEGELDYIVARLSKVLLPPGLRRALFDSNATTLLLSGDMTLLGVPWEALGEGEHRLGTRFALCRTPSLLRTAMQVATAPVAALRPSSALVVANPTGDLAGAEAEGALVAALLQQQGIEVTAPRSCSRDQFARALEAHTLIHFAGHTNYLRAHPASSYLLFSDGTLTISELTATRIAPQAMFYLSSCESGQAGQSMELGNSLGIGTSLLLKGAACVIASNWIAEDRVGQQVAEQFYLNLLTQRKPVCRTMQGVRRRRRECAHPTSDWALPMVMGHPFVSF